MTGSIRDFSYTTDRGQKFAFLIDESNAKMVGLTSEDGGFDLFSPAAAPFPGRAPAGFVMRAVSTIQVLPTPTGLRRRFWVGYQTAFNLLVSKRSFICSPDFSERWEVIRGYNEKYPTKPVWGVDSGLDDDSRLTL